MVPVWGWGALLCVVLKAHHSPSQSLHRCSAHSRGGRGNRTGLPALCSTAAGLTLTGIMADSHHTWEERRNEKEIEVENWRNGLNQPDFTVDLSAQIRSVKTSTSKCDQMSKSAWPCALGDVMGIWLEQTVPEHSPSMIWVSECQTLCTIWTVLNRCCWIQLLPQH